MCFNVITCESLRILCVFNQSLNSENYETTRPAYGQAPRTINGGLLVWRGRYCDD